VFFFKKQLKKEASLKRVFFKGWIISVIIALVYNLLLSWLLINCCKLFYTML
jgi:hypothetical protein